MSSYNKGRGNEYYIINKKYMKEIESILNFKEIKNILDDKNYLTQYRHYNNYNDIIVEEIKKALNENIIKEFY